MNKYKDGIEVQPMSRQAIRDLTKTLRSYMGVSDNQKFPVMKFLEFVTPKIYEDFNYKMGSRKMSVAPNERCNTNENQPRHNVI